MAQSSPLRNRTFYGTRDGVALSQGDAEAWRMNQARPSAPAPATAPAPPTAVAPSKWAARTRLAGRVGGTVAGIATEAARLGQIDAEQGRDAMYAEMPRSAGRLAGAWAGAEALGSLGAMTGPAAPFLGPAGFVVGGGIGYAGGDKVVDAARSKLSSAPPVDPAYTAATSKLGAPMPIFGEQPLSPFTPPKDPPKDPPMVTPARTKTPDGWSAPMQLPAGSKPEGWSLKPVVPNGMPADWRAPMKLPGNYPKAPEPTAPARDPAAEAAMRYAAAPDVVQAAGAQDANKAEAAGMRSAARIQDYGANARSTITGNMLDGMRGDTAELQRRMYNDLTSYSLKGFPALRAQRAEMWNNAINSANGVTAKGADNAAAADMQGMKDANESQRAFSDRRNKVDMFNVGTSEDRRTGDLNRAVTREGNTLRALANKTRSADKYADPSFAGKLYEDYLKVYKDPALAAQMANRGAVAAGDTADSPVMSMAQAADADNLQRGMRAHADGYFGFGNDAFDPKTAQPVDQAGFWDSILPGGVEYGDLKLRDAQGNETWAARSTALPTDEDFTSFSQRLARQRELARLRNGGK